MKRPSSPKSTEFCRRVNRQVLFCRKAHAVKSKLVPPANTSDRVVLERVDRECVWKVASEKLATSARQLARNSIQTQSIN